MARFTIRAAKKDECRRIAELYRLSSGGVADYVWSRLAGPGEDLLDVGRRRYEREGTPFSYENCKMVDVEGSAAGMLVAFPMRVDAQRVETDPVLKPYSMLEEERTYYICGMAVDGAYRRMGIGTALMADAETACRRLHLRALSLIVFEQNIEAKRLYERCGYAEKVRCPVVAHPLIRYTGDALLMVKALDH